MQPDQKDFSFDLDAAIAAAVTVHARVPSDGFTAESLGTERAGSGVLIRRDGIVLTIGYLVTEADSVWITMADGRSVEGHVLGYDQQTGFGLVQVLARIEVPAMPIGRSSSVVTGERVVVAGGGGREHAIAAQVVAKREFAGYWEYVLDEAIFTAPAHPNWGGTAVIGPDGALVGIGSLLVQQAGEGGAARDLNMVVPIDLLEPILEDLLTIGHANRPQRPWLGVYATEFSNRVVVANLAKHGPGASSDLRNGDIILAVDGKEVTDLASFFRLVWRVGPPGAKVPLIVYRDGHTLEIVVTSSERRRYLKGPVKH